MAEKPFFEHVYYWGKTGFSELKPTITHHSIHGTSTWFSEELMMGDVLNNSVELCGIMCNTVERLQVELVIASRIRRHFAAENSTKWAATMTSAPLCLVKTLNAHFMIIKMIHVIKYIF